jgi:hypothetical protein
MAVNPKLGEAVAIFKELGWAGAVAEAAPGLPLGTPEQRRAALAGLKSGEWGEIGQLRPNTYGWRSFVDVDEGMLGYFAIRLGVDARRAAAVLRDMDTEVTTALIAERGAGYAAEFIRLACVSRRRMWEHSASAFGGVAIRLVARPEMDVPENVEYMKDWAAFAAAVLGLAAELHRRETVPEEALIRNRFAEHVRVGMAVGVPATGPFGAVLPEGVRRGWFPRGEAIGSFFQPWTRRCGRAIAKPGCRLWTRSARKTRSIFPVRKR